MPQALTSETLKELVRIRMSEARALYEAGFYDGSCYLCGYVIELALKAVICKTLRLPDYPEFKMQRTFRTHLLTDLLLLSGLSREWEAEHTANGVFADNWDTVARFGPDQRYEVGKTKPDAEEVLLAVESERDGVLAWLSSRW